MSLRPRDRVVPGYLRDHFHGRFICGRCSAEVHNWILHNEWHDELGDMLNDMLHDLLGGDPGPPGFGHEDLAYRANTEGAAVVDAEFQAHPWREAWKQTAACLRLAPPKNARPAVAADPPGPAGRASQRAAMGEA